MFTRIDINCNGRWRTLCLPEGFTITLNNKSPYFNENNEETNGAFTFNFGIPFADNAKLLGYPNVPGNRADKCCPARLYIGQQLKYCGTIKVISANHDRINIRFRDNLGEFKDKTKGLSIRDICDEEIVVTTSTDPTTRYNDWLAYMDANLAMPKQDRHFGFPMTGFGSVTRGGPISLIRGSINQYNVALGQYGGINSSTVIPVTPFVYWRGILDRIAEVTGYEMKGDLLDDCFDCKMFWNPNVMMVPFNEADGTAFVMMREGFNKKELLPDISIKEFLDCVAQNGSMTFDPCDKCIRFNSFNYKSEPKRYIDIDATACEPWDNVCPPAIRCKFPSLNAGQNGITETDIIIGLEGEIKEKPGCKTLTEKPRLVEDGQGFQTIMAVPSAEQVWPGVNFIETDPDTGEVIFDDAVFTSDFDPCVFYDMGMQPAYDTIFGFGQTVDVPTSGISGVNADGDAICPCALTWSDQTVPTFNINDGGFFAETEQPGQYECYWKDWVCQLQNGNPLTLNWQPTLKQLCEIDEDTGFRVTICGVPSKYLWKNQPFKIGDCGMEESPLELYRIVDIEKLDCPGELELTKECTSMEMDWSTIWLDGILGTGVPYSYVIGYNGTGTSWTATIDFGDGSPIGNFAGAGPLFITHNYPDGQAIYNIVITMVDDQGLTSVLSVPTFLDIQNGVVVAFCSPNVPALLQQPIVCNVRNSVIFETNESANCQITNFGNPNVQLNGVSPIEPISQLPNVNSAYTWPIAPTQFGSGIHNIISGFTNDFDNGGTFVNPTVSNEINITEACYTVQALLNGAIAATTTWTTSGDLTIQSGQGTDTVVVCGTNGSATVVIKGDDGCDYEKTILVL